MKKVGLFFGSFNPIHVGHLVIAEYIADNSSVDEVWFVVSPHNPHKEKASLLADHHRMALVREAIEHNIKLKACDIEFHLPQPSYTVKTLAILKEKHPDYEFALILGEDILFTLHKWYNYEVIIENFEMIVYPRAVTYHERLMNEPNESIELYEHRNVTFLKNTPVMKISASYIRQAIKEGKSVRYLLSEPVYNYIDEMNFYK